MDEIKELINATLPARIRIFLRNISIPHTAPRRPPRRYPLHILTRLKLSLTLSIYDSGVHPPPRAPLSFGNDKVPNLLHLTFATISTTLWFPRGSRNWRWVRLGYL